MADDGEERAGFECPHCGETVAETPGAMARLVDCPVCEERFLIPSADGSREVPERSGESDEEKAEAMQGELDGLRMRHLVVVRRAAMRSRTYCIVGAGGCAMGAVKLSLMARAEVRAVGWHARQGVLVVLAVLGLVGVRYLLRRAAHWARESRGVKMPEPETAPDFAPLSDGSQHARNLEEMG
jgi:hypothetical protein